MKHFGLGLLALALGIALTACAPPKSNSGKLKIVSTTGMIHDIVLNIGSGNVEAKALMGPGVDPHLYKASEGDVQTLYTADVIFYNGLHLEAKLGDIFEKMAGKAKVIAVSRGIPKSQLRTPPEFKGFHDPHIWFDVALWKLASIEVENTLAEADPKHANDYHQRGTVYRAQLDALETEIRAAVATLPLDRRVLVTAHDAFGYFGRAYGLEVIGLQGISTQSEAGTQDVQRLATLISKRKIPAIFIESAIPIRTIRAVQDAVVAQGWPVKIGGELFSDAMGTSGTPEGTYIGMVRHNVTTIVSALSQ
jgi:manganese/zinc/iron transport system substrate-binding protein